MNEKDLSVVPELAREIEQLMHNRIGNKTHLGTSALWMILVKLQESAGRTCSVEDFAENAKDAFESFLVGHSLRGNVSGQEK